MDKRLKDVKYSLSKLVNASNRMNYALKADDSDLKTDAVIQRFEFTFELVWKTLKRALLYEGEICKTPKECLKNAFRIGLLNDEGPWLSMLEDRNLTAHIYDENIAFEISQRIQNYQSAVDDLICELKHRYE